MSSSDIDRDEGEVWIAAENSTCPPGSCQGKGMRSLRRVRAPPASAEDSQRPAKRRCLPASASLSDFNDADIAEMLLGLSHDHSSSPRDSHASDDDCLVMSPRSSREVLVPRRGETARRSKRVGRQPLKLLEMELESEEEEEEDVKGTDSEGRSQTPPAKRELPEKKVPARCKCGKRVSASHPPCKSELMLLCEKFRDRFFHVPKGPACRIDLNECATVLGVARRRLYDITIVYEAAEVILRTGKLAYVWQGLGHLPDLVQRLRREEEMGRPIGDRRGNIHATLVPEKQATHSLWTLSRKFIRLLLITEGAIQLSDAAEHLIGGPCKEGKKQQTRLTVERRLYDIGSILSTLNLIQRTYVEGKRQPAFSWNWHWAAADALPGGNSPSGRPENPTGKPAKAAVEGEARPVVSPGVGLVSPRAVGPLFAAPATAGSPAALEAPLGHTLPQLSFPVLVAVPGESGQMCLPSFPAISHPVITSGVPHSPRAAAGSAFPGAGTSQHTPPQLGDAKMMQLPAQFQAHQQAVTTAPSSKAHLVDFLHHCTDVANTQYLLSSGKHYRSIFQASQPMK